MGRCNRACKEASTVFDPVSGSKQASNQARDQTRRGREGQRGGHLSTNKCVYDGGYGALCVRTRDLVGSHFSDCPHLDPGGSCPLMPTRSPPSKYAFTITTSAPRLKSSSTSPGSGSHYSPPIVGGWNHRYLVLLPPSLFLKPARTDACIRFLFSETVTSLASLFESTLWEKESR